MGYSTKSTGALVTMVFHLQQSMQRAKRNPRSTRSIYHSLFAEITAGIQAEQQGKEYYWCGVSKSGAILCSITEPHHGHGKPERKEAGTFLHFDASMKFDRDSILFSFYENMRNYRAQKPFKRYKEQAE